MLSSSLSPPPDATLSDFSLRSCSSLSSKVFSSSLILPWHSIRRLSFSSSSALLVDASIIACFSWDSSDLCCTLVIVSVTGGADTGSLSSSSVIWAASEVLRVAGGVAIRGFSARLSSMIGMVLMHLWSISTDT
uniref:(northern house mosquito) hypothetical protein n=1 Tax=Culex pipiens TaxID=7175 RepID=A0A8D8AUQ7_CULPI